MEFEVSKELDGTSFFILLALFVLIIWLLVSFANDVPGTDAKVSDIREMLAECEADGTKCEIVIGVQPVGVHIEGEEK